MNRHVKINHRRDKYVCGNCNFRAFDKTEISLHQKGDHKEEDTIIIGIGCKPCKDGEIHTQCSFNRQPGRFVRWDSQMEKDLKCEQCSFETGIYAYLKNHVKLVHNDLADKSKLIACTHCEFQTLSGPSLKNHLQALHEKKTRYYCSKCDYKAFYTHYIAQHIKSNHKNDEVEAEVLQCLSCRSKTRNCKCTMSQKKDTSGIKDYRQVEPKSLSCTSCEFTTNSASSLNFHKRTQHVRDG